MREGQSSEQHHRPGSGAARGPGAWGLMRGWEDGTRAARPARCTCLGERRGERCKVAPTHSPPPPTTPQPSESQGKENKQFIASGTDGGKAHGTKDQTFRDHTLEERPSSA